ncbi:MAG: tetraacyldisaccharide 4'-kinase [Alphaproteobacteria bacterium]|nr:tetraacyldisaccharide 4'-kinase [Alphaproteobacteria bacterium]
MIYSFFCRRRLRVRVPHYGLVPVLCVGNITLGGAGKTPLVHLIIGHLRALGIQRPHIITRGYGGHAKKTEQVTSMSSYRRVGDEALLHADWAPTWVGADRVASVSYAAKDGADIIVMDDGLQNPSVYKDLSILVIDGPYGLGNGEVFPAGPLRETLASALHRVHAVVVIGEDSQGLEDQIPSHIPVFRAEIQLMHQDVAARAQRPLLAFCGIGRPQKFFDSLKSAGLNVKSVHSFPDHYAYQDPDLASLFQRAEKEGLDCVTTEKDYVRLQAHHQALVYKMRAEIVLSDGEGFKDFLRDHLQRNRVRT